MHATHNTINIAIKIETIIEHLYRIFAPSSFVLLLSKRAAELVQNMAKHPIKQNIKVNNLKTPATM